MPEREARGVLQSVTRGERIGVAERLSLGIYTLDCRRLQRQGSVVRVRGLQVQDVSQQMRLAPLLEP